MLEASKRGQVHLSRKAWELGYGSLRSPGSRRPMCRSGAGEALGFGLDHRLEGVASQRALLFQVDTDGREVIIGHHFTQKLAIGLGPTFDRGRQRGVGWMRR